MCFQYFRERIHLKKDHLGLKVFVPVHDKTYNKIYVTKEDSDQLVDSPSMTRVLVYPSLDSPETVEGTCDQRILIRLPGCVG